MVGVGMKDFLKIAQDLDDADTLKSFRSQFHFPKTPEGKDFLYFAGNSLGLQPKKAKDYIQQELDDWAKWGVEGHLHAKNPWLPYHEFLTEKTARLVGALPQEVIVMNTLTVNLHLMMVSFYRPTKTRFKIVIEGGAFPSDQYAVKSQIKFHGFDPETALIELEPRPGEKLLRPDDIYETLNRQGSEIALVLLGNVNYLTGQCYPMSEITRIAHRMGAKVGFDLAHGAGNLELKLHDDGPDFAVWCSYKYLNAGPGAIAGCFVHERHAKNFQIPRFAGWWGHNKKTRFKMGPDFDVLEGAEGWQLSNPPIFQLAALRASMEVFDAATMPALRKKSVALSQFLLENLEQLPEIESITPKDPSQRGTQLSLRVKNKGKDFLDTLLKEGVICDFREPDIVRVAPVPLYTRFSDLCRLSEIFKKYLRN
jgi:kynureninase